MKRLEESMSKCERDAHFTAWVHTLIFVSRERALLRLSKRGTLRSFLSFSVMLNRILVDCPPIENQDVQDLFGDE
jgi:hypothetical protein